MEMENLFHPFDTKWLKEIREKTKPSPFNEEEWEEFISAFGYEISLFLQNILSNQSVSVKHTKGGYEFNLSAIKKKE